MRIQFGEKINKFFPYPFSVTLNFDNLRTNHFCAAELKAFEIVRGKIHTNKAIKRNEVYSFKLQN